jgi:hypothetical protein
MKLAIGWDACRPQQLSDSEGLGEAVINLSRHLLLNKQRLEQPLNTACGVQLTRLYSTTLPPYLATTDGALQAPYALLAMVKGLSMCLKSPDWVPAPEQAFKALNSAAIAVDGALSITSQGAGLVWSVCCASTTGSCQTLWCCFDA